MNTVTYTYDSAGRKKTEGLTISGQTYTTTTGYNAKGELTSYTYPDGTAVGRSYTARGELYQLTHAGTTIDTRVYDNGGRMTSSTYNNGVSETRAYGTDNTLSSINFSGASIGNLTYGWDANKNKTSEAIAGTMSNYGFTVPTNGYDSEDRLVGFNRTSGLTQSWNLSAVGDWNSVTTNGSTETRTHGPTHELLTAGGQNVSTDTKGNITLIPAALRPNSASLLSNWDFDNRLNTADVGNNGSIDVTYKFDAMGRRVFRDDGTTATVYVQAGQQTIADYTAGTAAASPTYRYVYASYIDEPVLRYKPSASESLYYHRNQQYSVVALTNASAAIVERYAYSAYGVPTITNASGTVLPVGSVDNRYMYTGREWDSVLAQYHYRARMYDANLGRFASRDPIGFRGGDESTYRFVHNHPLDSIDPLGLKCTNYYFMTDFFNLDDLVRLPHIKPEFDKCDRVAPVCCWIKDGKQYCRKYYKELPEDDPSHTDVDPIIPHWPTRKNLPLEKDEDFKWAEKVFLTHIPGSMDSSCRGRNKCDCGDTFTARIVCDKDMYEYLEIAVKAGRLKVNPCAKTFTWDCKRHAWVDPLGTPVVLPEAPTKTPTR